MAKRKPKHADEESGKESGVTPESLPNTAEHSSALQPIKTGPRSPILNERLIEARAQFRGEKK